MNQNPRPEYSSPHVVRAEQLTGGDAVQVSSWLLASLFVLATIGIGLSGVLFYDSTHAGNGLGCTGEVLDCDSVLSSRFSQVVGIPVSIPAIGIYASILACLLFTTRIVEPSVQVLAWRILAALAVTAAGSAIWFVGLQVFWLEKYCIYCLCVHFCSLLLAGGILWQVLHNEDWQFSLLAMPWVGTVSVAVLVTLQLFVNPDLPGVEVAQNKGADLDLTGTSGSLLDELGFDEKDPTDNPGELARPEKSLPEDPETDQNRVENPNTNPISEDDLNLDELDDPDAEAATTGSLEERENDKDEYQSHDPVFD